MAEHARALAETIGEQLSLMQALNTQLEKEQSALVARDMEALQSALSRKVDLLGAIETSENQRLALVEAITGEREGSAINTALETLEDPEPVRAQWADLLEELQRCRAINEANGRVIQQQQYGVQRTIDLIQGDVPAPQTYGPGAAAPAPENRGGREISRA
ncbi:flagella synthesis protein FlgN [Aquisalimonas asiatica]|uniref:Flagellar biosynthesis/type III secretory pathway chaperone n=1 Tax=Aquisalimonas asiatica TaxID=406100 RepID=A0A1H8UJ55_9GAMM|nr:flagellar protein FlgN [Aquisalimonas asiatica]SEP03259.1 Flagellar biosynthesis/type III secretory pathway chaperone [Aquisalimonas asiatica]